MMDTSTIYKYEKVLKTFRNWEKIFLNERNTIGGKKILNLIMDTKEILHIYRRVSTTEQSHKYSLENQLENGIKKSKELGLGYHDWNEEGVSGSSENIEDREVLLELYSRLQMGEIKYLYVFDLSRLSRNPMVSSHLRKELELNEVKLYTNESDVDFKSDEQVLMYDFFSSINQFFVRVQRKKSMLGKVSHFKKGGWRGGTFPFGYESKNVNGIKKLVINPIESNWIRNIYDWYDSGSSIKDICEKLDKNNVKPRRGTFWSNGSVLVILKNDLYIGKDEMIDNITNPSKPKILYYIHKDIQIVDEETFNRVQNKIQLTLKRKNQLTKVKHNQILLRGMLFCEDCGEMYGSRVKPSKNEYYYYCRSRENNWRKIHEDKKVECSIKKSINIKNTDKQVWDTLIDVLGKSHIIKETIKNDVLFDKNKGDIKRKERLNELKKNKNYLNKKIHELELRLKDNRNWYLVGDIDEKQFVDGNHLIEKTKEERFNELEKLSLKIQSILNENKWINWLDKHKGWIDDLEKTYSLKEKKEIINEYVYKITVSFDKNINQHKLKLHLKLPIVNDKYNILKGGKNRSYEIQNGSSYTQTIVNRVKVGRKKNVNPFLNHNTSEIKETPPIKTNSLRWNKLDRGYLLDNFNGQVFLTCIVEITSPKLWVLPLSKNQEEKYRVIKKLRKNGLTFLEISDYLNSSNYIPQRTDKFTSQQVFGLLDKMNKRIKRLSKITPLKIYDFGLVTTSNKLNNG